MSDLTTDPRVDSGNLKAFERRVKNTAIASIPDPTESGSRQSTSRRSFAPDPSLASDHQPEDSWLLPSPNTSRTSGSVKDISPPRDIGKKNKETKAFSRPGSGRLSDIGSEASLTTRKASKIPRVANLPSSRSTPSSTKSTSDGRSATSNSNKGTDQKPQFAFGRRIEPAGTPARRSGSNISTGKSPSSTEKKAQKPGIAANGPKSAGPKALSPLKNEGAPQPKTTPASQARAPNTTLGYESRKQASKPTEKPGAASVRDPAIRASEMGTSRQAAGGLVTKQDETPPLLHAVSGSASSFSSSDDSDQLNKDDVPAALLAGQEVKAWELPPLISDPAPITSSVPNVANPDLIQEASAPSPKAIRNLSLEVPDEASVEHPKQLVSTPELQSHPVHSDSDSVVTENWGSREVSPLKMEGSRQKEAPIVDPVLPQSVEAPEVSAHQVEVKTPVIEPTAPGTLPTQDTMNGYQSQAPATEQSKSESLGASNVPEPESGTEQKEVKEPAAAEKMPTSPFKQSDSARTELTENTDPPKRDGIGRHKSAKKAGQGEDKQDKSSGCCGCTVM